MNGISERTREVIFFLCWHVVLERDDLPLEKPVFQSHAVKLFDVANQGHCYIVNSLRTWEYPIGDPVQFLNWFLAWKWGCVLLWPEVIFFSWALCASLTRLPREISKSEKNILWNPGYSPREKVGKLSSFWDWWAESLFESIIVTKYNICPALITMAACEKKEFWLGDLLTPSVWACAIGILSTLTHTEFGCGAVLAML